MRVLLNLLLYSDPILFYFAHQNQRLYTPVIRGVEYEYRFLGSRDSAHRFGSTHVCK